MARGQDVTLKQALDKLLETYKLKKKFDETSILNAWPEIMGPTIASRTTSLYIKDRKLFIKVESSVIKHELMLMRNQILERLNEYVGQTVVEEVVLL
jgi:predicted nucleic acid-binding Zn ribbon protein